MDIKPVPQLIDALSARTRFGEIMKQAEENNRRFLVSKRGKPKVVILSIEDYLKNIIKQPELLTKIQISAKNAGLDTMTSDEIEFEIKDYRKSKKQNK